MVLEIPLIHTHLNFGINMKIISKFKDYYDYIVSVNISIDNYGNFK